MADSSDHHASGPSTGPAGTTSNKPGKPISKMSAQEFFDSLDDEVIIRRYSVGPEFLSRAMIPAPNTPIRWQPISRRPANLGALDKLPQELFLDIFDLLDLQSVTWFSASCLGARAVVSRYPVYGEVLEHAPAAARALVGSGLVGNFSMARLRDLLRWPLCDSCLKVMGPFLFLPTGQRCCHLCLRTNPALRVIHLGFAQELFALEDDDALGVKAPDVGNAHDPSKETLTMFATTAEYYDRGADGNGGATFPWRATRLVSVETACERSLDLHGGWIEPPHRVPRRVKKLWLQCRKKAEASHTRRQCLFLQWVTHSPVGYGIPYNKPKHVSSRPLDGRYGQATVPFPFLEKGTDTAEPGLWCAECLVAGARRSPSFWIFGVHRAFSRYSFPKHIRQCEHAHDRFDRNKSNKSTPYEM